VAPLFDSLPRPATTHGEALLAARATAEAPSSCARSSSQRESKRPKLQAGRAVDERNEDGLLGGGASLWWPDPTGDLSEAFSIAR
jgi:hypothetical protein